MTATRSDGSRAPDTVREAARAGEPDRYLAGLLAPRPVRADLVAIAAFSAELLRVREIVRDAMIGEIRLQWWRDALHALARGEQTANPVADALGAAMHRHNLSSAVLGLPIEARSRELQEVAGGDLRAAADAEAALFEAALLILGLPATPASDAACADAGAAYAIARRLGEGPVRQSDAARGAAPAGDAPRELRARAREALVAARRRVDGLGPRALVAFLPLVMVEPYLHAQERRDADQSGHFAHITPLRRIWRIWRAKRRGRI